MAFTTTDVKGKRKQDMIFLKFNFLQIVNSEFLYPIYKQVWITQYSVVEIPRNKILSKADEKYKKRRQYSI